MDEDLTDAQWHQQQMLEQEMLDSDPAYLQWLDSINSRGENGIHTD